MTRTIEYLIFFLLALCFFAMYQFQSHYLDTDGYYHIKIAYVMREQGFLANFKWAHLSIWREHFSDKEFLYHVYLIPFTYFSNLITGAKVATVLLAATVATSFYAVLRLNNIRFAWFWWLLLLCSGGYFLYRVNVARPQVLSIIFVLWSIHFIINRKLVHLAVLCFLYTYSYTAYHLPLMFAVIVYGYVLLFERVNDWKLPAVTLGGMGAGMLLSPFFPDNVQMFFTQNFYVPWMARGSGVNLNMGGEFRPMDTRSAVMVNTAVIIPFIGAFFTSLFAPRKFDWKTISIFLIALLLILFTTLSKRFAEYSVPVTLLFCGFFFSPYLEQLMQMQDNRLRNLVGSIALVLVVVLGVNSYYNTIDEFTNMSAPVLESSAKYLLEHTEEDELVFTADWDDAPELFFFNHKNRYLVFLDPNFMYYWNPEVWHRWNEVANGELGNRTYDVLKDEFKIRYGVATNNFRDLRRIIERDHRMDVVHNGNGAYVFKLNDAYASEDTVNNEQPFKPPTIQEVVQYLVREKKLPPDEAKIKAERFYYFFRPRNWAQGTHKITDWKKEADRSLTWED